MKDEIACVIHPSSFRLHPSLRPRGAAWSARLPVTQEIVGSNPIEVAWKMAWYANRQSGEAQTFVTAGSTPALATFGLCSSRWPVKPLS